MRYPSDSRLQKRSGQMIIFVTLSLFVLFSVMRLAVDLGYSYYVKGNLHAQQLQADKQQRRHHLP